MIKKLSKIALVLFLTGFLLVLIASLGYRIYYRKAFENMKKLESLAPGITLNEAKNVLGDAVRIDSSEDGKYHIYYYEGHPLLAAPLGIKVRVKDKIVEEIWISDKVNKIGQELEQPLQLTIKSDKQVYREGENVVISFIINNTSEEDFSIAVRPERYFFSLKVVNSKGDIITKWTVGHEFFTPHLYDSVIMTEIPSDNFFILKSKNSYKVEISLVGWLPAEYNDYIERKIKLPKDKYELTFTYSAWKGKITGDVDVGKRWFGTLISGPLTIEIAGKEKMDLSGVIDVKKKIRQVYHIEREKILYIAVNKAQELGFSPKTMDIIYDEGNEMLKKHLTREGISVYNEKTNEWSKTPPTTPEEEYPLLKGRKYQAVYFSPKQMQLGGTLTVFIDKDTGEVITYIRGK